MSDLPPGYRQASFRGVPFAAEVSDRTLGRRNAIHEFPGSDNVVPEDMGAAARRMTLRGFLVENSLIYGGGDVFDQRDALEAAALASGTGVLVHPTRGPIIVACLNLSVGDRTERGWIELTFEFIEAGLGGILGLALDAVSAVLGAADGASSLLAQLFGADADGYATGGLDPGDTGSVGSLLTNSAQSLGAGVAGVFTLSGTAAAASASLGSATSGFLSASSSLGLVTGSGLATATAATGVIRSVTALSDPGTSMDNMGQLADAFGDGG